MRDVPLPVVAFVALLVCLLLASYLKPEFGVAFSRLLNQGGCP